MVTYTKPQQRKCFYGLKNFHNYSRTPIMAEGHSKCQRRLQQFRAMGGRIKWLTSDFTALIKS